MSTAPRPHLQISASYLGPVAKLDAILSKHSQNMIYARNGTGKSFLTRAFRYLDLHYQKQDISDAAFNLVSEESSTSQGSFSLSQGSTNLASLSLNLLANQVRANTHERIFHVFSDDFVHAELRQRNYDIDGNIDTEIRLDQSNIDTKDAEERLRSKQNEVSKSQSALQNVIEAQKVEELVNKANISKRLREYTNVSIANILNSPEQVSLPSRIVKDILNDLDALKAIPAEPDYPETINELAVDAAWLTRTEKFLERITSASTVSEEIKELIAARPDFFEDGLRALEESKDDHCPFCRQSIAGAPAKDHIELYLAYFADAEGKHKKDLRSAWSDGKAFRSTLATCLAAAAREILKFEALKKYVPSQRNVEVPDLSSIVRAIESALDSYLSAIEVKGKAPSSKISLPDIDLVALFANLNKKINTLNAAFLGLNAAIKSADAERKTLQREACVAFEIEFAHTNWASICAIHQIIKDIGEIQKELEELKKSQISAKVKERVAQTFEVLVRSFFGKKYSFDKINFVLEREEKKMARGASRTLSDGEKTAIAFCYFIACSHKKVENTADYKKLFFVFDDPITSMSYDFVFAIAQTLKNLSIGGVGEVSINPADIAKAARPELIIFTHSSYFYNICVTNNVVKDDGAFFLHKEDGEHKISKRARYIAPFEQYLKELVEVHGGRDPDHTTGNAVRCVLEAVGRFCHPDKCDSLSNFVIYLAGDGGFEIKSVLINNLSHGTYYDESPSPEELREACGEAILIVEKYARGQIEMVKVFSGTSNPRSGRS